jgi:hypothetical protein
MEIEINKNFELNNEDQCDCSEIPKISASELSYDDFFHKFMMKNLPVIITDINLLKSPANLWIDENKIIIDEIGKVLKNHQVPVYNCAKQYFNSHEKITMSFDDYVKYWKSKRSETEVLYLKDFHLKAEFPELNFYDVPNYFASDWLNEYLIDTQKDDYRFVYIGTEGTW